MRVMLWTLLLLLGFVSEASAQMVISVDTSISRNTDKSLAAAMALSALVPGLGQNYLGERQRVKPYIWADAVGWTTVAIAWFAGETYLRSAQSYATQYAGVVNPPKDPVFLAVMAQYRSRAGIAGQNSNPASNDDYNMTMIRDGVATDQIYPNDPAHTWDWGSSDNPDNTAHMQSFGNILHNYRMSKIVFQVALGVVVVNRLVSMLDVIRIHRATSVDPLTMEFVPTWSPESAGATLLVAF